MIGITSEFTKVIENCERHPEIKYIQILFCQRNIGIYYPEKRELDSISNYLKNKKVIPIIHISMGKDPKWWNNTPIHPTVANYYGYFRRHILREIRSEEHTSELQSHSDLVCRLLLEKK